MTKFQGKTVLITGAAMGMGRLFAEKSLSEGARVVLWDINENALQETTEDFIARGGTVDSYVVDVSDYPSIYQAADEVFREVGYVDVIFNNAGIVVGNEFLHHTPEQIEKTIAINTCGVMHVARAFLPHLIEKQSGHIVNIASAAGLIPNPRMSVYAGSKWAVIGWSESLRIELEKMGYTHIHVTTVTPGYISTGMFEGATAPLLTPILTPEKIVNLVWKSVKRNKILVRAPWMVKLTPFLRGIMPARIFDFIAGNIFGVYNTMDHFKGRSGKRGET